MSERKPLTLEELRKMTDKPAYLDVFDKALQSGWHIIKTVTKDKIVFRGWNTVYVPIEAMGKDYNLYAYKPPRLDRSAWEPCEFCREQDREVYKTQNYPGLCSFEVAQDGPDEIVVNAYNHNTPLTEDVCFSFPVLFCPKCGRPLNDAAWEMLERRLAVREHQ